MQPFSTRYPKPMLPIGNKPLLQHQIEMGRMSRPIGVVEDDEAHGSGDQSAQRALAFWMHPRTKSRLLLSAADLSAPETPHS